MNIAAEVCNSKLVMVHEGGYSENYVPFCGHAVLQEMSGSQISAPDPFAVPFAARQPDASFDAYVNNILDKMVVDTIT